MSVCACCTHLFLFFPLVFVLVNGLLSSGFLFLLLLVCFGNACDFVVVVAVCVFLL